jgi:large subunit ribosomal protein L19
MKVNIDAVEKQFFREALPPFRVGDQMRLTLRIVEGGAERSQVFEGVVIKRRGHGLSENFTVRKISYGIGVERTIPLHSPRIEKIEVVRSGHVRRSRLFFLRDRSGKAARLDEKVDNRDTNASKVAPETSPAPVAASGQA